MENVQREKALFVKKLQTFYIRDCKNEFGIKRLDYLASDDNEFIYVSFNTNSQKRICVYKDNEGAMLSDFCHFLDHFDDFFWLMPAEASFRSEFLEDE